MAESKGVWLDKDTGKIVKGKQPSRARQIVSPGSELEQDKIDAIVERYQSNVETATAEQASVETATTEKAVTTKTTKK